jgi:dTDP-4-amino-4,6-dideoxygalactose transaminase
VHYAGVACRMDAIMAIANKHNVFVVEDAAQAIDSFYTNGDNKKQALGSIGHLAAFSFHESKNIQCGEGGLLVVNDEQFNSRAEIIWEKGTNRAAFFRGEVDKYNWVDVGSSFLPSEITAAFLYAQLQALNDIQRIRKEQWQLYFDGLKKLADDGKISLPDIPNYATNNAHLFYIVCKNIAERHDPGLHTSPFYLATGENDYELKNAERFSDCLLRLPLYVELGEEQISIVIKLVHEFYEAKS